MTTQTAIRVLAILGSLIGGMTGAFIALMKLAPERAKIIIGYQLQAIEGLQAEIVRQDKVIELLTKRVSELEALSKPSVD